MPNVSLSHTTLTSLLTYIQKRRASTRSTPSVYKKKVAKDVEDEEMIEDEEEEIVTKKPKKAAGKIILLH